MITFNAILNSIDKTEDGKWRVIFDVCESDMAKVKELTQDNQPKLRIVVESEPVLKGNP